jgi:hypothetical protein
MAPQEFYQKLVDRLRERFESRREKCSYTTMPGLMATIKVRVGGASGDYGSHPNAIGWRRSHNVFAAASGCYF